MAGCHLGMPNGILMIKNNQNRFCWPQIEIKAAILFQWQGESLAGVEIPNPGMLAAGQLTVEGDVGLVRLIAMAVAEEDHLAAIVSDVAVLHHVGVGTINVEVMRQVVETHQTVVPRDEALLGRLRVNETVLESLNLPETRPHRRVSFRPVGTQAQRLVGNRVDADQFPAGLYKTEQPLGGLGMEAFHIDEQQSVVFPLVEAELAFLDGGLIEDVFAHIVHTAPAFVDGFPHQGFVRGAGGVGEGFILHPEGTPHVVFGVEDGDVGVVVGVLQGVGEPGLIVIIKVEKGPPWIVFAVVGAVAQPSREGRLAVGRVVEAVEHAVGHARDDRLVAADL